MITQVTFNSVFHYMELMSFAKSVSNKRKPLNTLGINYHHLQQLKMYLFSLFEIMNNFRQKSELHNIFRKSNFSEFVGCCLLLYSGLNSPEKLFLYISLRYLHSAFICITNEIYASRNMKACSLKFFINAKHNLAL